MLHPLRRLSRWKSLGYICRECRQHLHSTRRVNNTAVAESAAAAEDDWFSNFNEVSADNQEKTTYRANEKSVTKAARARETSSSAATPASSSNHVPPTRHFSRTHPAVQRFQSERQSTAALKGRLQTLRKELRAKPPSSSTRESVGPIPSSLQANIALYERVIELRQQGSLKEPSPIQRRETVSSVESDKDLERLASLCGKVLELKEKKWHNIERRVLEEDINAAASAHEADRRVILAFKQSTAPQLRKKMARYKRFLRSREGGQRLERPDEDCESFSSTPSTSPQQVRQALSSEDKAALLRERDEIAETIRTEFPRMKEFDPTSKGRRSISEVRKQIAFLNHVLENRRKLNNNHASKQNGRPSPQTAETQAKDLNQAPPPKDARLDPVVAQLWQKFMDNVESESQIDGDKAGGPLAGSAKDSPLKSLRRQLAEDTPAKVAAESGAAPSVSTAQPLQSSKTESSAYEQAQRMSIPFFGPPTKPATLDSSARTAKRPTIVQKVREARDRQKWGGAAVPEIFKSHEDSADEPFKQKFPSHGKVAGPAQDQNASVGLFADSSGDLAESQSSPAGSEARTSQDSPHSSWAWGSSLSDLKDSLLTAIKGRNDTAVSDARMQSIERNIKAYEDAIGESSNSNSADGAESASNSLADLHNGFGLLANGQPAVADDRKPVEPAGENAEQRKPAKSTRNDAGQDHLAKPSRAGSKKTHRSLRAVTKRPSVTSVSNGTNAASDDGDGGQHKKLADVVRHAQSKVAEDQVQIPSGEENMRLTEIETPRLESTSREPLSIASIRATDLQITALNVPQPPVPGLEYGLDRVLFNPGVYHLQDPTSRVYNFSPYLQDIMPAPEFDFNALKEYKTSSEDRALSAIAKEHQKKYIGSTSSMTSSLGHFHYLLSNWRPLNLNMLSRGFPDRRDEFTKISKAPTSIFLRWKPESRTYAIDADKEYDGANVLMMLGKSMEKLLTLPTSDFERYRKSDPREVSQEAREEPEAFEYTTMGDFLMRSQLDAHDPRLPGTGMFDLKTRAVVSIRMDAQDFESMLGYEIHTEQGRYNSYEREYYDMIRSTMLKYMLQARMGRMQGIFAAYHNIQRIFGFQYISIMDMDRAIHGQVDPCLGDQEFKLSLELLNKALDQATAKFPERSLRMHFETTQQAPGADSPTPVMSIFAEPMEDDAINQIQNLSKDKVREFERSVMGIEDKQAAPGSDEQVPTEYPPATPEPETDEPMEINEEEEGGDQVPTQYPPATPEPASEQATDDQAPIEYPPATPEPTPEAPETIEPEPAEDSTPTTYPPTTPEPSSASSSNPDLTSSASAADPSFLSSLSSRSKSDLQPLFAATLMIKSKVNSVHVPRPTTLTAEDDWTVEYLLTEYPESEATWARYAAVKDRRREAFANEREEDEDASLDAKAENGTMEKKRDSYIEFLRDLARRGREYRAKMNAAEARGEKKFAWKKGGVEEGPGVTGAQREDGTMEDVGEYIGWLYGERERKM